MCYSYNGTRRGGRKTVHLQQFSKEELLFSFFFFFFNLQKLTFHYLVVSRGGQGVEFSFQGTQIGETY